MELRHRRRAFVNGASVSAVRLQSHNSYALSDTAEGAYYVRTVASEWRTLAFIRTFTVHHTFADGVQKLKDPDHLLHRLLTERAFSFCISSEPGFTVQIGVPLSP